WIGGGVEGGKGMEGDLPEDGVDEDAVGADQQRVAVGRGPRHRLGRDDAARARPRLDDDGRTIVLADLIAEDADQRVDRAPGWDRDHHSDRVRALRPGGSIAGRGGEAEDCQNADRYRVPPPKLHEPPSEILRALRVDDVPELLAVFVEDQPLLSRRGDPGSPLDLAFELASRPARIAEHEQALARALAAADRMQHLAA